MEIKKYTFDGGKYEVQAADDGSSLNAYRYGEFWQNMIGDNLTAAMLNRIDDLEEEMKKSLDLLEGTVNPFARGTAQDRHTAVLKFLMENKRCV